MAIELEIDLLLTNHFEFMLGPSQLNKKGQIIYLNVCV